MPVIRWIMNHMVIIFVTVLVVAGLAYQDQIKEEMVQLGWVQMPEVEVASVSASTATPTESAEAPVKAPLAAAPAEDAPGQMPTHLTAQAPMAATVPAEAQVAAQAPAQPETPDQAQQAQAQQAPVQQLYGYGPQGYGPRYGQAPQGYAQAPQGYGPRYAQAPQGYAQAPQGYAPRQMMGPQMRAPQMPTPPSMGADVGLDEATKGQWAAARTAYWERDLEKAEELYKALVESSTEADVAGELGNIYFVQGRHEEAAAMFYEAGLRHLKGDNPVRAGIVMGALSQLDREKATDLRDKMMKMQRAQVEAQIEAQKKVQAELMNQESEQTNN